MNRPEVCNCYDWENLKPGKSIEAWDIWERNKQRRFVCAKCKLSFPEFKRHTSRPEVPEKIVTEWANNGVAFAESNDSPNNTINQLISCIEYLYEQVNEDKKRTKKTKKITRRKEELKKLGKC